MKSIIAMAVVAALSGCSLKQYALNNVSDALANGGGAFAVDDDPDLVRAAAPFSLKLTESLLTENPRHRGLLVAAARGFTQYAYAFLQQEAEEMEETDIAKATALQQRAARLYRRARDYGLRALALTRPDVARELHDDPRRAAAQFSIADVPALYWTAAAWAALIASRKDSAELLAELPAMEALIDRALELDEPYEHGAIHTFLIGYEPARLTAQGDAAERSRAHFVRAVELSAGAEAAPFIALAESVSVPQQRRAEFEALLKQALGIDPDERAENRLANLVAQRRARWLLARTERLFID
jgi:predicted anti-sigma-YlaC factor YlaD